MDPVKHGPIVAARRTQRSAIADRIRALGLSGQSAPDEGSVRTAAGMENTDPTGWP